MSQRRLQQTARLRDHQGIAVPARAVIVFALHHSHAKNETVPDQPEDDQRNYDQEASS